MLINLSVIIVTYNSSDIIIKCLNELINAIPGGISEIIVVDNASIDGTLKVLESFRDKIKIISLNNNTGFAGGVNRGIFKSKGEIVLIINPDLIINYECLNGMIDFLSRHEKVGAVAPRLLYLNGEKQPSCRRYPTLRAILCNRVNLIKRIVGHKVIDNFLMTDADDTNPVEVEWVNHLGVNFEKYKDFKERDQSKKQRFNIVSLCNLDESKRIQDNIMAVKELHIKGYDISYDIYGSGKFENKLKQLVNVNYLAKQIRFNGFLRNEEVIEKLSKYDLFSLPSWEEAFGAVYLEALAAGIPAIGIQKEGPDEINRYGDIIYTVHRSNIKALASTIEGLIQDYNSSQERVMLGQKAIIEEFNWKKNINSLLTMINKINYRD